MVPQSTHGAWTSDDDPENIEPLHFVVLFSIQYVQGVSVTHPEKETEKDCRGTTYYVAFKNVFFVL